VESGQTNRAALTVPSMCNHPRKPRAEPHKRACTQTQHTMNVPRQAGEMNEISSTGAC